MEGPSVRNSMYKGPVTGESTFEEQKGQDDWGPGTEEESAVT